MLAQASNSKLGKHMHFSITGKSPEKLNKEKKIEIAPFNLIKLNLTILHMTQVTLGKNLLIRQNPRECFLKNHAVLIFVYSSFVTNMIFLACIQESR